MRYRVTTTSPIADVLVQEYASREEAARHRGGPVREMLLDVRIEKFSVLVSDEPLEIVFEVLP
jgi:hypothetical protein